MNYLLSFCIFLFCTSNLTSAQIYRAGVAVYRNAEAPEGATPTTLVEVNVKQYQKLMESVKDKVDIVVFPEYGLTTLESTTVLEEHLKSFNTVVGKVGTSICNTTSNEFLAKLACAAKTNNLYAVVNLLERDNNKTYVTNVGLDPTGTICLRCRKRHLVKGPHFSQPPAEENTCVLNAKFKKDVSVSFAVMFDTDMLYPIPEGMKQDNVIMTSSIINALPLEFGLSLEAGFAVSNNVNLLVAGFDDATKNYGGSGIYLKNGTSVVAMTGEGLANALNGSIILVREVEAKPQVNKQKINFKAQQFRKIPSMTLPYKKIDDLPNTKKEFETSLDDKKLTCKFKADVVQDSISPYKWVAISNKTTILDQTVDVFICALVVNNTANSVNLKTVSISSNLRRNDVDQTLPLVLKKDMVPASFVYEEGEAGTTITLNEEAELLTFGIVQISPHKNGSPSSNTALIVVIVLLVLVLVGVVGFLIWRKRQRKNRSAL